MSVDEDKSAGWRVDKHIPVAVLVGMLVQLGGIVWWARGMQGDVTSLRDRDMEHDRRIVALEAARERDRMPERMATLETEIRAQHELLRRIDERTERLVPRR